MNVIMDACSVINLHNGGALEAVCSIAEFNFQVGPIVGGECSEGCAAALAMLHDAGLLEYLTDAPLDAEKFLEFVSEHRLGEGEAECIMLAELDAGAIVSCDDLRGRKKTQVILGDDRLIGSIGLLKQAVACGLMTETQANSAYRCMKDAGGFLPDLTEEYFATN